MVALEPSAATDTTVEFGSIVGVAGTPAEGPATAQQSFTSPSPGRRRAPRLGVDRGCCFWRAPLEGGGFSGGPLAPTRRSPLGGPGVLPARPPPGGRGRGFSLRVPPVRREM